MDIPERYWRYTRPEVRARVAALAVIADEPWMQDWPLEVADPDRVNEFIRLYEESDDDEVRFALMELILYSLDRMPAAGRALWPTIEELLVTAGPLHAYPVIYWSCVEEGSSGIWAPKHERDEQFGITPLVRRALARLRAEIGFAELLLPEDASVAVLRTRAAAAACRHLRALLLDREPGSSLPDTDELPLFLSAMERVVADALGARFDEFRWHSIDGLLLERATVTRYGEVELVGLCYLLPDNPVAPFSVRVRVGADVDGIAWMDCKLGERDPDTGAFEPMECNPNRISKELHSLGQRAANIEWAFEASIGERG